MRDRSIFLSSWSKNQTSVNAMHDSGMWAFLLPKLVKTKKFSIIFLYLLWLHTSFFFLLISSVAYKLFHTHLVHYTLDFYSDTIPFDGAPSYKGHAVKYSYKITVGTSRVQGHSVLLRLPFRIMVLQGLYKSHFAITVHTHRHVYMYRILNLRVLIINSLSVKYAFSGKCQLYGWYELL